MWSLLRIGVKYVSLILIGLIGGLIILEFGLRWMGAKPETYLRKFSRYHPILGWEKTPNTEGEFIRGDIRIHEKMNARGLRDVDYPYEKPDYTIRILVLGDSFTEGYDVDIENLFTEILERKLNADTGDGLRYEVINAGTGGYSTDQEYLFYVSEGYKYHPDIIVMMMYAANDIYYNVEDQYGNYSKPLFEVKNDSLILTNTPLPQPRESESIKNIFRDLALYPIVTKIILTRFPAVSEVLAQWGFISKSTLDIAKVKASGSDSIAYPSSFSIFSKRSSDKVNRAWKTTEYLIRAMNSKTQTHGSRFLLFSIPDRFQIYPEIWERTQSLYRVNEAVWDPGLPDKILDSLSKKSNVPFLNFGDYLNSTPYGEESLYNGVHWNVRGNEIAADYLYEVLTKKGWLR